MFGVEDEQFAPNDNNASAPSEAVVSEAEPVDVDALYAEIDRLDEAVSELTNELSAREERIESLEAELRDKSRAALAATTPAANLARALKQQGTDLEAATRELAAARQIIVALKEQLASRSVDIATECDRAERAEQELAVLRAELAAARDDKRTLEQANSALTVQLCEAEERLDSAARDGLRAAS